MYYTTVSYLASDYKHIIHNHSNIQLPQIVSKAKVTKLMNT